MRIIEHLKLFCILAPFFFLRQGAYFRCHTHGLFALDAKVLFPTLLQVNLFQMRQSK